jgi:hypothetical protein
VIYAKISYELILQKKFTESIIIHNIIIYMYWQYGQSHVYMWPVFIWLLSCLSFFDLRLLINLFVSSHFSCSCFIHIFFWHFRRLFWHINMALVILSIHIATLLKLGWIQVIWKGSSSCSTSGACMWLLLLNLMHYTALSSTDLYNWHHTTFAIHSQLDYIYFKTFWSYD